MRALVIGPIRVRDDRAFAIFSQAGAPAAFFPLQAEHGRWVLAAVGPTTLPSAPG
jgi:hypothetical protein